MPSAFLVLVREMCLSDSEHQLTLALLASTPVAVQGQSTLIPLAKLYRLYGHRYPGRCPGQLTADLDALLNTPRKVDYEVKNCSCVLKFPVLQDFMMATRGGSFLTYELNPYFLERLHALRRARELPSLY